MRHAPRTPRLGGTEVRTKGIVAGMVLAVALTAAPAWADGQDGQGGQEGHAHGRLCQGQSKKHVRGMRGTPFSTCVRAMAQLDRGTETSAREACEDMTRRHVEGQRRTPYSSCVSAGQE